MRSSPVVPALIALFLLSTALAAVALAQPDKAEPIPAVEFRLGSDDGVFVAGTTSDPAGQLAHLPVGFKAANANAPDFVASIQVRVTYDPDAMEFVGFEMAPAWPGSTWIDTLTAPGEEIVVLHSGTIATPTDFLDVGNFVFTPLCQPELNPSVVAVDKGPSMSFVTYQDDRFYDGTSSDPSGTVTTADYVGWISVLDPDPTDTDTVTIDLEGVVDADAEIDVPVYLSTNANVWRIQGMLGFDADRLQLLEVVPSVDCNPWAWTWGEPILSDSTAYIDIVNSPFATNDTGEPCELLTMRFRVLGDWRGDSTLVTYAPMFDGVVLGSPDPTCSALGPAYGAYPGTVRMLPYTAAVRPVITDMIYPADVGENMDFDAWVQATHNFTIGGDDAVNDPATAALRVPVGLDQGLALYSIDRPSPAGDLWFTVPGYDEGPAKSMWTQEFYTYGMDGVPDARTPRSAFETMFGMRLMLADVTAPAAFDTIGYAVDLLCTDPVSARPARLRDAVTGTIEVACGDGLELGGPARLLYANGELICYQSTSTRPANVVQTYYARSSFALTDFRVTVQKSGPHSIVAVNPASDVAVDEYSDHVTFTPAESWEAAVHRQFVPIGSITYSTSVVPVVYATGQTAAGPDKDSQPPVTWCWDWTTITFGGDTYLHDATGDSTFLFTSTGNVGTRYDCSGFDPGGGIGVDKDAPAAFALHRNAPNPFNPQTTIAFAVPRASHVTVAVHDLKGRRVAVLVDGLVAAGEHEVVWDGRDAGGRPVASGTYFAVMRADGFQDLRKMILLK